MSLPGDVLHRLKEAGLSPRKGLGQNFLMDETALRRIVQAAELTSNDTVLEIGAGPGGLTWLLATQARQVVAIEIDPGLVDILRSVVSDFGNVQVVQGDILTLPLESLLNLARVGPNEHFKVIGNLPYYITSAILRHLLESSRRPSLLVVTVQEEVARRIVAQPGEMSLLAVSVQFYGRARIVGRIPAGAFYPPPKVDSAIVRIDLSQHPRADVEDVNWFFSVVRAGFSARRKQLHNALVHSLALPAVEVRAALDKAGVDPSRRAQTLSLDEWACLSRELRRVAGPQV